jgi:kynurenine formamidase
LDIPTVGQEVVEIHRILLHPDAEIVIVESVANLDQVPDRFTWSGFPLPLKGGDGSPIRSVAICDPEPLPNDLS